MFTSWTFTQRYLFYVYNDTTSRNCSSIINVNREKYQIIKSQCWRLLVTNCETRNDGKFHRAMTEDLKQWQSPLFGFNLRERKIELMTNISFIWNIQLVKNYGCFFSLYLWRFPFKNGFVLSPKINDFEIEEPWKIWKLIYMIITPLAPEHRRHFQRMNNNIL